MGAAAAPLAVMAVDDAGAAALPFWPADAALEAAALGTVELVELVEVV